MTVSLVAPLESRRSRGLRSNTVSALRLCALGACLAAAVVLVLNSDQGSSESLSLQSEDVFDQNYTKPLEGHWIHKGPWAKWMTGSAYAAYHAKGGKDVLPDDPQKDMST